MSTNPKPFRNIHPSEMVIEEMAECFYLRMEGHGFTPEGIRMVRRVVSKATPILRNEARVLNRLFGQSMKYWLNLQKNYDEREAKK